MECPDSSNFMSPTARHPEYSFFVCFVYFVVTLNFVTTTKYTKGAEGKPCVNRIGALRALTRIIQSQVCRRWRGRRGGPAGFGRRSRDQFLGLSARLPPCRAESPGDR